MQDQFNFVFRSISGSFSIEGDPIFFGDSGEAGLMIRQDLDPDSAHVSLLRASFNPPASTNAEPGSVFPHFRTLKGGATLVDGDPEPGGYQDFNIGPIRLERLGNSIHLYTMNTDQEWVYLQTEVAPMQDEVYVGLAAHAHSPTGFNFYEFEGVRIVEYPLQVMRSFPTDEFEPGMSYNPITLTASVRDGQTVDAYVREVPPRGSIVSNVQASIGNAALLANGEIEWNLDGLSGEATLTYDITLPRRSSVSWRGVFNDGERRESHIGGIAVLPASPEFDPPDEPARIDPNMPTVIQVEHGFPIISTAIPYGFMLDPRTESGITLINVSGSINDQVEFQIEIPQDDTYYFFAKVRGDDGNSDSWFFSINEPATNIGENAFHYGSPRKVFHARWITGEQIGVRSAFLAAGVHYLYIANREDCSGIEWVGVTNNPNLNFAAFDELAPGLVVRSFDQEAFVPGEPTEITVQAITRESASADFTVTETPPSGWQVSDIAVSAGNASLDGAGNIIWTISAGAGVSTMTYQLASPSGVPGGLFDGFGQVEGFRLPTSGPTSIARGFAGVNDPNPVPKPMVDGEVFIEAEEGYLVVTPADGNPHFVIGVEPTIPSLLYAVCTTTFTGVVHTDNRLDFWFEVFEPGDYRIFTNMRTPDGESDSYWVGMDNEPVVTEGNADRYVGSGIFDDQFHISWLVTDAEPDKSWFLDAGVHVFNIYSRESGTQIDWLVITNNLEQDPLEYTPPGYVGVSDWALF